MSIPVIASGGAGSVADIAEVLTAGRADAALAASIFHYGEITIGDLKQQLKQMNIKCKDMTFDQFNLSKSPDGLLPSLCRMP